MDYKNRELKVDIVLLSIVKGHLSFLAIKRPYAPFKDLYGLPGGYIPDHMSADSAAYFQLEKKTGLDGIYHLEQLKLFSNPKRDPNGPIASMAYMALVDAKKIPLIRTLDSDDTTWIRVDKVKKLAFDHKEIVLEAKNRVNNKVRYSNLAFELAGNEFTVKQLIDVFEVVVGKKLDASNIRKKLKKLEILEDTGRKLSEGPGRPSPLFKLNQKKLKSTPLTESFFS